MSAGTGTACPPLVHHQQEMIDNDLRVLFV